MRQVVASVGSPLQAPRLESSCWQKWGWVRGPLHTHASKLMSLQQGHRHLSTHLSARPATMQSPRQIGSPRPARAAEVCKHQGGWMTSEGVDRCRWTTEQRRSLQLQAALTAGALLPSSPMRNLWAHLAQLQDSAVAS